MKIILIALSLMIATVASAKAETQQVNLYSAQKEHLIRPLLEQFTKETGIKVNMITGDAAALVTRLEREGKHSPADLLLTADIGNIYEAVQKGLLQPIQSDVLNANIPAHLRGKDGRWYGLTMRARLLFIASDNTANAPSDYMDITQVKWQDGILTRPAQDVYNQSLMAFMIHHYGEEKALDWAKGVVKNLARKPQGGDRDQLSALAIGEGKVAIANSYYFGMVTGDDPTLRDESVVEHVTAVYPNQNSTGVHVNIRGGGVTTHAKHKEAAITLLEFLSGKEAQKHFATINYEYPVHPEVDSSAPKGIKFDDTPLETIGALRQKAIMLLDKSGWR